MYNDIAIIHSYPLCISLAVYGIRFSAGLFSYMFFDGVYNCQYLTGRVSLANDKIFTDGIFYFV